MENITIIIACTWIASIIVDVLVMYPVMIRIGYDQEYLMGDVSDIVVILMFPCIITILSVICVFGSVFTTYSDVARKINVALIRIART